MDHYKRFEQTYSQSNIDRKSVIEKLFRAYNQFNSKEVINEWVEYTSKYSLGSIEKTVDYAILNFERFPSIAKFINAIQHDRSTKKKGKFDYEFEQAKKETKRRNEDAKKAYDELIKRKFCDEDVQRYVEFFIKEIYGDHDFKGLKGAFRNQALAELFRANMDSKRAIQKGLKQGKGVEYL